MSLLLAACTKVNSPLKLYYISSSRFTSGSKTVNAGDTLSTRLYAATSTDTASANRLNHFRVTVTYSPLAAPFAYPTNLATFSYISLPTHQEVVYLDSALTTSPRNFLYTSTFGARTTSGTETWLFTATDTDGNSSARSFTLAVRRPDSTQVFHDYTLRLPSSNNTYGSGGRRFIDLKSGLVYPAYALTGTVPNPVLQEQTDLILLTDAARLATPKDPSVILNKRWTAPRQNALFNLTSLTPATFANIKDTLSIQQQFVANNSVTLLNKLVAGQVYAFHTYDATAIRLNTNPKLKPIYGLMLVQALPAGSTAGLQLLVRLAKQPRL
ncbi:hypothetical protein A0257_11665 [Hymenobacter psoromatis]|nr:hypothetical protein A0257_11665 [Hymenobacter psoromatis]